MVKPADSSLTLTPLRRAFVMLALVISGEVIFILPFVIVRIFRPTYLDVFGLTNLELGTAFAVLGTVAMVAYFPGGLLADRFSARRLMTLALILTGGGGLYLGTIPSLASLRILYFIWGITTMLLFWAALIRATREWGGQDSQGKAYGLLDGGRGLTAALFASISVAVFAWFLPADTAVATLAERTAALTRIIHAFTGAVFFAALFVWLVVPESSSGGVTTVRNKLTLEGAKHVIRMPAIWLLSAIVICAYVGMKSVAFFSLYARDAFGYDDVAAAQLGTLSFWIRPFAAIGAGVLGDRFGNSRMILISFSVVIAGSLVIASGALNAAIYAYLFLTVAGTSAGIYALRGIYFSLFEESRTPLAFTGSAIGIVSVIGYSPDIFSGPLFGYLIDHSPGATGHQHVFAVVAAFSVVGLLTTVAFQKMTIIHTPG